MTDRRTLVALLALVCLALAGCGGTKLIRRSGLTKTVDQQTPSSGALSTPVATKNTTRIPGADPIIAAALVSLAVFPSAAPGTHPTAVALTSSTDWQAALAASVLMGGPLHAPLLFSVGATMPPTSEAALTKLAPSGAGAANGAQVVRIGDVPKPAGDRLASISGNDPYTLAAGIDRFVSAVQGQTSRDVIIASGTDPAYAMPAAGYAAESGDPILFVSKSGVPSATRQALLSHQSPHIYVLGPPNVIPNATVTALGKYGTVKRVGGDSPAANSVAFAVYRDPGCKSGQPCAHVPGSFGWAMRSPGHGYVLLNATRPLDAAAAAPLSGSGDFGPALLVDDPTSLPKSVLSFFLDYATPGYTEEGPTAAVYNHGWVIGNTSAVSVGVQAELDSLLEPMPVK
ncbi:MAG: cell wall-binding repeat-containing protein [Solirubrobacteraceae bacterium]